MLARALRPLLLLTLLSVVRAGDAPPPPDAALVQRAEKIAAALRLDDAAKATRVRDLVAQQYAALRPIHQQRDAGLKLAKETANKSQAEARRAEVLAKTDARLADLHAQFLAALARELTPEQIDAVKDGMTYGVVPLTFRVYQKMLPDLTAEQKAQILAWLTEAREHAMDASTSEEKHASFGKYKGRINNYLSKAGYNMKEAEKNLTHRAPPGGGK
jgi:Spy/CpxP family protein refolding chaperone